VDSLSTLGYDKRGTSVSKYNIFKVITIVALTGCAAVWALVFYQVLVRPEHERLIYDNIEFVRVGEFITALILTILGLTIAVYEGVQAIKNIK
jgi:hypothetical protein